MLTSIFRVDRPKWFQLYFFLAIFQVLTVVSGLYLTHRIISSFSASVGENEQWAGRLTRFGNLSHLAGLIDVPPNNVFESRDVASERENLAEALIAFRHHLVALNDEFKTLPQKSDTDELQEMRWRQRYLRYQIP